jgi:DNA-binding transcriptional ArsR family regulator
MRESGNVISLLLLIALISAALDADGAPKPLSVSGLARRLGLPPETVRRHAGQLAEDELLEASRAGLSITPQMLQRPGLQLLFAENATNVQRLLTGLAERGVIAAWEASP